MATVHCTVFNVHVQTCTDMYGDVKEMADDIIQARDSGIDDAGEGLFAKKSLKQVGCTISIL